MSRIKGVYLRKCSQLLHSRRGHIGPLDVGTLQQLKYVINYLAEDVFFGPFFRLRLQDDSLMITEALESQLPNKVVGCRFDVLVVDNFHDAIRHIGLLLSQTIYKPSGAPGLRQLLTNELLHEPAF